MTEHPRILALFGFGGKVLFGQERGNMEALSALREQGCEVLCLIRKEKMATNVAPALDARCLAWRKVHYIEKRLPGRLLYLVFRNPVAFLHANWEFFRIALQFRPTRIHAFNEFYVLNFLLALTLIQTPMIYRAGDTPTLHNWVWRRLWRFVVWRATRFVANSEFVARSLQDAGVPSDRITVIYNKPPARPRAAQAPLSLPLSPGQRVFAYIGQIGPQKGPDVLIEAFREIAPAYPHARLLIAGRISDWDGDAWARALRDGVQADPLTRGRITFLGQIEDVPTLLANCEALIVPSLCDDAAPNTVIEAKQAGRPTIGFPRGGIPELIEHGRDGLVCSEASVAALIAALRVYLGNPGLADAHGAAARKSLDRLGVPRFAQKWMDVYSTVPAGQPQLSEANAK
jgi:glycosyltransferase involved in cell wall biosynthesis